MSSAISEAARRDRADTGSGPSPAQRFTLSATRFHGPTSREAVTRDNASRIASALTVNWLNPATAARIIASATERESANSAVAPQSDLITAIARQYP